MRISRRDIPRRCASGYKSNGCRTDVSRREPLTNLREPAASVRSGWSWHCASAGWNGRRCCACRGARIGGNCGNCRNCGYGSRGRCGSGRARISRSCCRWSCGRCCVCRRRVSACRRGCGSGRGRRGGRHTHRAHRAVDGVLPGLLSLRLGGVFSRSAVIAHLRAGLAGKCEGCERN
jgi:hypothetical protein